MTLKLYRNIVPLSLSAWFGAMPIKSFETCSPNIWQDFWGDCSTERFGLVLKTGGGVPVATGIDPYLCFCFTVGVSTTLRTPFYVIELASLRLEKVSGPCTYFMWYCLSKPTFFELSMSHNPFPKLKVDLCAAPCCFLNGVCSTNISTGF